MNILHSKVLPSVGGHTEFLNTNVSNVKYDFLRDYKTNVSDVKVSIKFYQAAQ